jgi:hypothetical protein
MASIDHPRVAVAAVLADQIAGPPQPLHRVGGPAPGPQPAEQGPAGPVGRLDGVGKEIGRLGRVRAPEHLAQALGRRSVADADQAVARDQAARRVVGPLDVPGGEPRKGRGHDRRVGLAEAGGPPGDVRGEEVQPELRQARARQAAPHGVHGERLAGVTQTTGGVGAEDDLRLRRALRTGNEISGDDLVVLHGSTPLVGRSG